MTTTEAGLFSRVSDTRTVRGLLLPFGELSRPSLSKTEPVMFSAASVSIPRDPSAVTLNDEHDRFNPIGRATSLEVTDAGVVAEFSIFNTDEGDAYLANPTKRKLSAELGSLMRAGSKAVRSRLTGAAVCTEGAFESAALFSLAPGVNAEFAEEVPSSDEYTAPESASTSEYTTEFVDDEGTRWRRVETSKRETTVTKITDSAPADEETPEDSEEETMTASAAGQTPAPLVTPGVAPKTEDVDLHAVFSAMASVKSGVQSEDNESALFALADIKTTGSGALPAAGVVQPAWVGKLWQGKEYVRKYLPLNNHTFGPIEIGGRAGFRLDQGTALVQKRGGEKTELPTGSASTSKRESTRESYGYAADVAAEWTYLSGGAEILESFWKGVANSYAKVTDEEALATMFRVASRDEGAALSRRVAPQTLPTGTPANLQYYPGVVMLIQALEAISDADDDPAWAVVNPELWRQLLFTPKDLLPEFVSLGVTAGTGEGNVEGKVQVRKAPQTAFIGTKAADPQVIAGSKNAIEFRELGTTPIQIDALNVAKFGVDRATVGFLETFVVRPEATVFIGTAA
ncbi:hypothetical protein CVS54_01372 [Microbacterium oxydans]|uniref:Uncharacterized protein n=1 Tax=Microbacterium oxydans TaxID=82380 RepID=A0A3S9WJ04_9MICO|nr:MULTISPECIES: hypothetical protein [Microbacterium]AZS40050.1 hypothetical protein CVS54_01372 [Microbacterium oxydans]